MTKEVLVRASGDLANLIASVPKGIGNPPAVGSVSIKLTWRGVKTNETRERIDGTVKDVNGKPIEGVWSTSIWPLANGTTTKLRFWTDQYGKGHVYGTVGAPPYMQHKTVTATVTTNQTTITKTAWFYRTPKPGRRHGRVQDHRQRQRRSRPGRPSRRPRSRARARARRSSACGWHSPGRSARQTSPAAATRTRPAGRAPPTWSRARRATRR